MYLSELPLPQNGSKIALLSSTVSKEMVPLSRTKVMEEQSVRSVRTVQNQATVPTIMPLYVEYDPFTVSREVSYLQLSRSVQTVHFVWELGRDRVRNEVTQVQSCHPSNFRRT